MKEMIAIVRLNMMNKTKRALADAGLGSITARDALGRGKGIVDLQLLKGAERGYEEAISQLGQSQRLIPKRALLMVVNDELVEKAAKTIRRPCGCAPAKGVMIPWMTADTLRRQQLEKIINSIRNRRTDHGNGRRR
jgi:nitrogen regulatory protein PII